MYIVSFLLSPLASNQWLARILSVLGADEVGHGLWLAVVVVGAVGGGVCDGGYVRTQYRRRQREKKGGKQVMEKKGGGEGR